MGICASEPGSLQGYRFRVLRFPKECPGFEANAGSVEMRSEKGNVIGMDEDLDRHLPAYFKKALGAGELPAA